MSLHSCMPRYYAVIPSVTLQQIPSHPVECTYSEALLWLREVSPRPLIYISDIDLAIKDSGHFRIAHLP